MPDEGSKSSGEQEAGGRSDEDERQRVNRELIELLNELRVALPGVQVLFAFLLTIPFSQGFVDTTDFQRDLLFAVLLSTALSAALLIAPSAWHRVRFRQADKERILLASNRMAIVGLGFLAASITGAVMLVANFAFSDTLTVVAGSLTAVVFLGLWYVIPLANRPDRQRT